jgi:hypothetical protein
LDGERERIEANGLLHLNDGFFVAAKWGEITVRIEKVAGGVTRIEFNGATKFAFRTRPV